MRGALCVRTVFIRLASEAQDDDGDDEERVAHVDLVPGKQQRGTHHKRETQMRRKLTKEGIAERVFCSCTKTQTQIGWQ